MFHTARVAPEKAVFRPALPLCFQPGMTEMQMAKMSYADQLRHPNWQRRRLEKQEAADWQCEVCGAKDKMLHVHHREYFKGRMAWEYSDAELKVLCEECHTEQHRCVDMVKALLGQSTTYVDSHFIAAGLLAGYFSASYDVDFDVARAAEDLSQPYFHLGVLAFRIAISSQDTAAKVIELLGLAKDDDPVSRRTLEYFDALRKGGNA